MKKLLTILLALALLLPAMSVFATDTVTINIALANNPLSQKMADLAKEFYKPEGVEVNIVILPENDLRQKMTTEASSGGTAYDMFYFGPYEAITWAQFGWLENLEPYFAAMDPAALEAYDRDDIFQVMRDSTSLDGDAYALPYYGEGSFLMYNTEIFEEKGLTMPDNPTWDEVYDLAKAIHDPDNGMVGMTMRGMPGWGMSGAPFVTMINAFGGQFYDMEWNATVDTPEQRAGWEMYKNILRDAGQPDIITYSYNECIALMQTGKCGIYYDATSICGDFEKEDSPIKGKVGYVVAPHEAGPSGWMWNWSMAINPNAPEANKQAVFNFMIWATSKEFVDLTLTSDPTGASTPPAQRLSTYERPEYQAVPYAAATVAALDSVDFNNPCVNPVPYVGLQYIAIPEFADAGDKMTEWLAAYTTDQMTLDEAIANTQALFEEIAVEGGYK